MSIETIASSPITIKPKFVYGLQSSVQGNVHFTAKDEIIYPVAGVIAVHDYTNQKQKFLRLAEHNQVRIVTMSPNRKLIALSQWNTLSNRCIIDVFNTLSLKKKRTLKMPKEIPIAEAAYMEFTQDSNGLAILSKEPDAFLIIFYFDKSETIIMGRVSNGNQKCLTADVIACNLSDSGLVAVGGHYSFKLMSRQDKSFGLIGTMTGEHKIITSLVWITAEILVAGTSADQLLFIENGDPKQFYKASKVTFIDLEKAKENEEDSNSLKLTPINQSNENTNVNCLTFFENGFCFAQFNSLQVFIRDQAYLRYSKRSSIELPINFYEQKYYKIKNVSINASMTTVIVTSCHRQIYISKLYEPESMSLMKMKFSELGVSLHIDGIKTMTVCAWKSIVMTAANDLTIRVWNYQTGCIELVKKYQNVINVIELHPSGMFVAIGFTDELQLMELMLDDLKSIKTFNYPNCIVASFAHRGHLLAFAYDNKISIVSVFSFDVIQTLKGHCGNVLNVSWSKDDKRLVSCGNDGAIYEWEIETGKRCGESVQKDLIYTSVALTAENVIYASANNGVFREIFESEIVREIIPKPDTNIPITTIAVARSDLILFIGNENGSLYNVQVPFMDAGGGKCTNYRFFSDSVSVMKITFDDRLLITASNDGTLIVWYILNADGKTASIDSVHGNCVDVIVPREDLLNKIHKISNLEFRLNQIIDESEFRMNISIKKQTEEMNQLKHHYQEIIKKKENELNAFEKKYFNDMNVIKATIDDNKNDYTRQILEIEQKFNEKLIIEFNKTVNLQTKMNSMKDEYEKLLKQSQTTLSETTEILENGFKIELKKYEDHIRRLMNESVQKKNEYTVYCKQMDADFDRQMIEIKTNYEVKLNQLIENVDYWRTNTSVMDIKIKTITTNYDELQIDKNDLLNENERNKLYINQLEQNIIELEREVAIKEQIAIDKEKQFEKSLENIQEQENGKLILIERLNELRAEIEQLENNIRTQIEQIELIRMDKSDLKKQINDLNVQVDYFRTKYRGILSEIKIERDKYTKSQILLQRVLNDLYKLADESYDTIKLKQMVALLRKKYLNKQFDMNSAKNNNNSLTKEENKTPKTIISPKKPLPTVLRSRSRDRLIQENLKLAMELNEANKKLDKFLSKKKKQIN